MLNQFLNNVKEKLLFEPTQKVLLAISGGIDSMVLLHLFEKSGFEYGIAHCNFNLRGKESDGDEQFVRDQVQQHGTVAFFESFDTKEYAQLKGVSIEMAARELRYEFFERIRKEHNYDYIATAHHQDDLIETFFLNLSRKTGLKGLTGIKEKAGNIVRPLLIVDRTSIEGYAAKNYLEYREDSSNREVVYQRNFLRHKILPLFSELNPSFKKNFLASVENLKEAEKVYNNELLSEKNEVLLVTEDEVSISITKLQKATYPRLLLLEILSEYSFKSSVVDEVLSSLETESGKKFFSKTHRLVKDREKLFISKLKEEEEEKIYYIEKDDIELFSPFSISIEKLKIEDFELVREAKIACIDLDSIQFPLLIRKWKQGDYFQPLGMTGFKKLSDFFIDRKLPLHEKENTWLLCSGKKIVWIMGQRLDNRFKVNPNTKHILKIEME